MSWDPDELPDMDSMSEVPQSMIGTAQEESMRDDVFGSVADNTQEVQEQEVAPSPLLHSDSEDDKDNSVLQESQGRNANTEVMSPKQ